MRSCFQLPLESAVSRGADAVATAVHSGDHAIYPDCRPDFIDSMEQTALIGCDGFINPDFHILAPFLRISKTDIATLGESIGVPWEDTWSCYKGGDKHCGTCGTCVERREAFDLAGIKDLTEYDVHD